ADGAMANTLQVKVTDANGNTLAGQTVSVLADNSATTAPTVTTQQDGTVEILSPIHICRRRRICTCVD
ncbi:Ig-like domain-containing protein, partial [Escherichia coli]|uniref:Ig-like domain-containing protein n=1 Tax=Escherichia coli TaxID=562 RepID=UPI003D35491E